MQHLTSGQLNIKLGLRAVYFIVPHTHISIVLTHLPGTWEYISWSDAFNNRCFSGTSSCCYFIETFIKRVQDYA